MKKIYLLLPGLLASLSVMAQGITLGPLPNPICLDATVTYPFVTSGTFQSGNEFRVQLRSNFASQTSAEYTGTVSGTNLTVTMTRPDVPDYMLRENFQVRIVSTRPYVESAWSNTFRLQYKPQVTLTGSTPEVVNPLDPASLNLSVFASLPATVVFDDSSRVTLQNPGVYGNGNVFQTTWSVVPDKTTTYRAVSAQNACGVGTASGTARVQVNGVAVRTVGVSPQRLCQGNTFLVSYSKLPGSFGAGNQFRIRLTPFDPFGNTERGTPVDIPATEEDGALRAVLPGDFPVGSGGVGRFTVRVVATDPATVGEHTGQSVEIRSAPGVEFTSTSTTVDYGSPVFLQFAFRGIEPYVANLSDGSVVRAGHPTQSFFGLEVRPEQTTNYAVTSLRTGCGSTTPSTSVTVTVRRGMRMDSLLTPAVCEGQEARIRLRANAPLPPSGYQVVLRENNTNFVSSPIPAQLDGNVLRFTPNALRPNGDFRSFSITVINSNSDAPAFFTAPNTPFLLVRSQPSAEFFAYSLNPQVDNPQSTTLSFALRGGGPHTVTWDDGLVQEMSNSGYGGTRTVSPPQTTTYRITSVKNACGESKAVVPNTVTVRRGASPAITLAPVPGIRCAKDSIEISFATTGTFADGNVFRIQFKNSSMGYGWGWEETNVLRTTSRSGLVNIKLPRTSVIRVVSTNPVTTSNEEYVSAYQVPQTRLLYENPAGAGNIDYFLPGETRRLRLESNGDGFLTAVLTDGQNDYPIPAGFVQTYFGDFRPQATGTYRLKSVQNECGTGTGSGSFRLVRQPYRITLPRGTSSTDFSNTPFMLNACAGTTVAVPYLLDGPAPTDLTLQVQVAAQRDSVFTTVASGVRTNPARLTLPATLTEGNYLVRLVASNGEATSNYGLIRLSAPASATLTSPSGGSNYSIPTGTQTGTLQISATGTRPWQVWLSDGSRNSSFSSPFFHEITPRQGAVYTLRAVANACGYGTTNGEVAVNVPATLLLNSPGGWVCAGGSVSVNYTARGDFQAGNVLRFVLQSSTAPFQTVAVLDSTTATSGPIRLRIPASLPTGSYLLQVRSTRPVVTSEVFLSVVTTPNYRLSGNSIINTGQGTTLLLNRIGAEVPFVSTSRVSYTLSDGTSGEFYEAGYSLPRIVVRPTQTTTYTVTALANQCGAGRFSGTATVTVNPPAERTITPLTVENFRGVALACTGDTVVVNFQLTGVFSAGNRFTVQFSDSTLANFRDLPTFPGRDRLTLKAFVPESFPPGNGYKVRVVASDPGTAAAAATEPFPVRQKATARFDTTVSYYLPGRTPKLVLRFTGDAPWAYSVGTDFNAGRFTSSRTPDTLTLAGGAVQNTYRVFNLSNVCGVGRILDPSTVRVELITATEPVPGVSVRVFPNPTTGRLQVKSERADAYALELIDASGRVLLERRENQGTSEVDLADRLPGLYLLRVRQGSNTAVYKVVKE